MSESEKPNEGELILYQTSEGTVRIEVLYESETFWLNQKRIAELFGVDLRTVSYHLGEIYASGELSQAATLRKIWRVQREGNREVKREIEFYNLDAIISVGYRVNSTQATQFRICATQTLREFVIKGFVLDDERLKLNKRLFAFSKIGRSRAISRKKSSESKNIGSQRKSRNDFHCPASYRSRPGEELFDSLRSSPPKIRQTLPVLPYVLNIPASPEFPARAEYAIPRVIICIILVLGAARRGRFLARGVGGL
jgi:hypothetical protein